MVKKLLLIALSIVAFKAYSGPGTQACIRVGKAASAAIQSAGKTTPTARKIITTPSFKDLK